MSGRTNYFLIVNVRYLTIIWVPFWGDTDDQEYKIDTGFQDLAQGREKNFYEKRGVLGRNFF